MEKCAVKFVLFNDDDFGYWKNWICNYPDLVSCYFEIVYEVYVISATLDNTTYGEL
jgi:hypothetical protein